MITAPHSLRSSFGWTVVAAALAGLYPASAVTLTVTPASVGHEYAGAITLRIADGLTNGEPVIIQKFVDANANGAIDPGETMMQSIMLNDGEISRIGGITNLSRPYDLDGAQNGVLTLELQFTGHDTPNMVGSYLFRVSSPSGRFSSATMPFVVTNEAYGQRFTGRIVHAGTNVPYGSVVLLDAGIGDGGMFAGGVLANASGGFEFAAKAGTYRLMALRPGYVTSMATSPVLTLAAGATVETNLTLTPATQTISGRVHDSASTAAGLASVSLFAQTSTGWMAWAISDANGDFTVPVTPGNWSFNPENQDLVMKGYVTWRDSQRPVVNTATGSVAGVMVPLSKATALVYGTVKNNAGTGVAAMEVYASGTVNSPRAVSRATGGYAIGVLAGSWWVGIDSDTLTQDGFASVTPRGTNVTLTAGEARPVDFQVFPVMPSGMTVSPAVITNDYLGKITLSIGGLQSGASVVVEKYADLNDNGQIDAGEPLVQSFTVTDGQLPVIGGVRNLNVPGDEDLTANGQIRAELWFPGVDPMSGNLTGHFLYRAYRPAGGFQPALQAFEVKPKTLPQGISGRVTDANTGLPMSRINIIFRSEVSGQGAGVVTDSDGRFTLYGAPGRWQAYPIRNGYVCHTEAGSVTVNPGQFATLNLTMTPGTLTVSGRVFDRDTGAGLGGIVLTATAASGEFAVSFTDADGQYSTQVVPGFWKLRADQAAPAGQGYVGYDEPYETNLTTHLPNLDIPLAKANALIYGTIQDDQHRPVLALSIWGEEPNKIFQPVGRGFPPNGDYALGTLAGNWTVGCDNEVAMNLGYLSPRQQVYVGTGQAARADLVLSTVTDEEITATVKDSLGQPIADVYVYLSGNVEGSSYDFRAATDANGACRFGVVNGTWTLGVQCGNEEPQDLGYLGFDCVAQQQVTVPSANQTANFVTSALQAPSQWLPSGIAGCPYTNSVSATGGRRPYTWSLALGSAPLPDGLTLGDDGEISGTPTAAGAFEFLAQVIDAQGTVAEQVYTIDIAAGIQILTADLPRGSVGVTYASQLQASSGAGTNVGWSVVSNSLPSGLTLSGGGLIAGTPRATGTNTFVVAVTDHCNLAYRSLTLIVGGGLEIATTSPLPEAVLGESYQLQLEATGGTPNYSWSRKSGSAQLPSGLILEASGLLHGAPATNGTFFFIIRVTDQGSPARTADKTFSLTIATSSVPELVLTTTSLPGRQVDLPYRFQLQATGGVPPYTWQATGGLWPEGLDLNAETGVISGTPSRVGFYNFTGVVQDSASHAAQREFTFTVHPTPPGFPIANAQVNEMVYGAASDGTNFLLTLTDSSAQSNLTVRLLSSTGALLGSPVVLNRRVNASQVAFGQTNYLMLWEDRAVATNLDLYGGFVSLAGALQGAAFPVCTAVGNQTFDSRRSLVFDGTNYFVAWRDQRLGANQSGIYGRLISSTGALLGSEIPLATQSGNQVAPSVVFDGARFLVLWIRQTTPGVESYDIWGLFISRAGVPGAPFRVNQTSMPRYQTVRAAVNGSRFLVAWTRDAAGDATQPAAWDIYGRLLSTTGEFVGDEFPLTAAPGQQISPSVSAIGTGFLVNWLDGYGGDHAELLGRFFYGQSGSAAIVLAQQQGQRIPIGPVITTPTRFLVISGYGVWPYSDNLRSPVTDADVYGHFLRVPPRMAPPEIIAEQRVRLRFEGDPGLDHRVEFSPDLATWSLLFIINPPTGAAVFTNDAATSGPHRYYRVGVAP